MKQLVVFALDEQRFALALASVERVARVVAFTSLPKAPAIVLGVINAWGDIVPVFDLRQRFRLPRREVNLSDQLIIARTSRQRVALVADAVSGVVEVPQEEIIAAEKIFPEIEYVQGVVKLQDGLVLIHDLDKFLSPREEKILDEALKNMSRPQDSVMTND
jgi:purine-binding chemotaxis protein CheW